MLPNLFFVALSVAAPEAGPAVRLVRGQEFVYRGTCDEINRAGDAVRRRGWALETRIFVLEVAPGGSEVAVFTVVRDPAAPADAAPASARLAVVTVTPRGACSA